jgi:hypothetical protein
MGLAAVPALIQLVGMQFLPESPRFLMQSSSRTHAAAALRMLRSPSWDVHAEVRPSLNSSPKLHQHSSAVILLRMWHPEASAECMGGRSWTP